MEDEDSFLRYFQMMKLIRSCIYFDFYFQNILLLLDRNLDKERKLLLERLRKQDEMLNDERKKQFEIAKLKRQQRQLQQEEKFNQIELIFQLAKQQEYS